MAYILFGALQVLQLLYHCAWHLTLLKMTVFSFRKGPFHFIIIIIIFIITITIQMYL